MAIWYVDERSTSRYESDSRKRVTLKIEFLATASKIAAKPRPPQTGNIKNRKIFTKRHAEGVEGKLCIVLPETTFRVVTIPSLARGVLAAPRCIPQGRKGALSPLPIPCMVFFPPCIGAFAPLWTPTIEKKRNAVKISSLPVSPSKPARAGSPPRFYITQNAGGICAIAARSRALARRIHLACIRASTHGWCR